MKVIFLHIPKTAGQSVHSALVNAFGAEAVCPARVNDQLHKMSISELNRYQVFSGHLDWSLLDCIKGPKYVFTILREPVERILSFYFFLLEQAKKMSSEDLGKPQHQGLKAALELGPKKYFLAGPPHLRRFLDDHYDNFYAHYFAARHYQGRSQLAGLVNRGALTKEEILRMAQDNLACLDDVFSVEKMSQVFDAIRALGGRPIQPDERYSVNRNTTVEVDQRREKLAALGADEETFAKIDEYCALDRQIWQLYSEPGRAR